ncbi:MAG: ABC transporter permease, partial [Chroococcales cyanobacterium]
QLPSALKVVVYLLPLTYTSIGLRAAAYDMNQFPWYSLVVLAIAALGLSFLGARKFANQQD